MEDLQEKLHKASYVGNNREESVLTSIGDVVSYRSQC